MVNKMPNNDRRTRGNERVTHFLLALVLIFSCIYTILEYSPMSNDDYDLDEEVLKKLPKESDLIPAPVPPTVPAPPKPTTKKLITNNIKLVNEHVEHTTKPPLENNTLLVGDGKAEIPDAKIDKAIIEKPVNDNEEINKHLLEELLELPGGFIAFIKWLTKTLQYPKQAQQAKIEGKVLVSFLINTDGSITELKIEKNVHPLLDNEAMRVMRTMPKWRPGMAKGKPCQTKISIPVVFQI